MRVPRAFAAPLLALALAGCASAPPLACNGGTRLVEDVLYFGTAMPEGTVTQAQWDDFVGSVVTPRFPEGLTTWPASGQWRGADGTITREATHVLQLLHADEVAHERAVREIIESYKATFRQESVLRVQSPVCAAFQLPEPPVSR